MQFEHPAVRAWVELRPEPTWPAQLEVLKEESYGTAVYRLGRVGNGGSAVIAKRCWQSTALIERTIYEEILPDLPFRVLHYYGAVEEPNGEFWWLFLEDVGSYDKYQPHVREHRIAAARWLAIMNISVEEIPEANCLPDRGAEHYLELLRSTRETILSNIANPALTAEDLRLLESIIVHCNYLSDHWGELASACAGMPQTLVHGDFIENNVRVRTSRDGIVLLPFDWEKAGWGVPAEDISRACIDTYASIVRQRWPGISLPDFERLANVGRIFRCLVFLDWIAPRLAGDSLKQPINDVKSCQAWLSTLIEGGRWQG
jgi:hypothetical protein